MVFNVYIVDRQLFTAGGHSQLKQGNAAMIPALAKVCRTLIGVAGMAFLAAWSVVPGQAAVNLVTDGEFLATSLSSPGGYLCNAGSFGPCTFSNLTDWNSTCQSSCGDGATPASLLFPGTNGVAFNNYNGLYSASDAPLGGNTVAIDGDPVYRASIFQTVGGLTAGNKYTVTFQQAGAQQYGLSGATTEYWEVALGAGAQNSTTMNNASMGFTGWFSQSLTFTATAASEVLSFTSYGAPGGEPPIALLADVSLTAVPEPSTWALMVLGFAGLGFAAYRRTKGRSAFVGA